MYVFVKITCEMIFYHVSKDNIDCKVFHFFDMFYEWPVCLFMGYKTSIKFSLTAQILPGSLVSLCMQL